MCCWLCTGGVNCLRSQPPAAGTAESSRLQKQRSTPSRTHSHSTIKCNPSVTITKMFSLKMTQQGRSVLRLMIKPSYCFWSWLLNLGGTCFGLRLQLLLMSVSGVFVCSCVGGGAFRISVFSDCFLQAFRSFSPMACPCLCLLHRRLKRDEVTLRRASSR
jgi:hypothetical protein